MTYTEIIVSRVKAAADVLLKLFESRGFMFDDASAENYINIFGDEDINEMCWWIERMEEFMEGKNEEEDI